MRRKADPFAVAAFIVSLLVAIFIAGFGVPALLDVNKLSRANRTLCRRCRKRSKARGGRSFRR